MNEQSGCPCEAGACECYSPQAGRSRLPVPGPDFSGARSAMLSGRRAFGPLFSWRANSPDDVGNLLVEGFAYLQDVLSFYSGESHNSSFIGTARRRGELRHQVELLGYRPLPGVASSARVSLNATAEFADVPGGVALRSEGTADVPPQIFTTDGDARVSSLTNTWSVQPQRSDEYDGEQLLLNAATQTVVEEASIVFGWNEGETGVLATTIVESLNVVLANDGERYVEPTLRTTPPIPPETTLSSVSVLQPTQIAALTNYDIGYEPVDGNSNLIAMDPPYPAVVLGDDGDPSIFVLDAVYDQIRVGDIVTVQVGAGPGRGLASGTVTDTLTGGEFASVHLGNQAFAPVTRITVSDLVIQESFNLGGFKVLAPDSPDDVNPERYKILFEMVPVGQLINPAKLHLTQQDADDLDQRIPLVGPVPNAPLEFRTGTFFLRGSDGKRRRV